MVRLQLILCKAKNLLKLNCTVIRLDVAPERTGHQKQYRFTFQKT